jgi:hypothetical protein
MASCRVRPRAPLDAPGRWLMLIDYVGASSGTQGMPGMATLGGYEDNVCAGGQIGQRGRTRLFAPGSSSRRGLHGRRGAALAGSEPPDEGHAAEYRAHRRTDRPPLPRQPANAPGTRPSLASSRGCGTSATGTPIAPSTATARASRAGRGSASRGMAVAGASIAVHLGRVAASGLRIPPRLARRGPERPLGARGRHRPRGVTVSFVRTGGPTLARLPWQRPEAARRFLRQCPPIPRAAPRYPAPPADGGARPEGPAVSRPGPWPRP